MLSLPPEVVLLLCVELANRQDFGTLFNCALSNRGYASPALECMYKVHSHALSILSGEGNDAEFASDQSLTYKAKLDKQKKTISKWALLWRSIVRSSLGNTAHPYCTYIRSLDLGNLDLLFEDPAFREVALDEFFAGDMAQFWTAQDLPPKKKTRSKTSQQRLNISVVSDLVGESIITFVSNWANDKNQSVALEELAGKISSTSLQRWAGRLERLRGITLWDSASLSKDVAAAISKHGNVFNELMFFTCSRLDMDHDMGLFFSGIQKDSLKSLSALTARSVGPESLLALNHHSKSLKTLKLSDLGPDAIKNLSLLRACDALETLDIQDDQGLIDLEVTENDTFLEVVSWLGSCIKLQKLRISKLVSGPSILTMVCLNNDIRLQELEVEGYRLVGNVEFHQSLSHQTSLESLQLKADAEECSRDDIHKLVSSICELKKLKSLNLLSTSDYFRTDDIVVLAKSLKNLEELWFGGYDATDDIWEALSTLSNLRSLNIHALSSFSVSGIINFVSRLKDTNQGFQLYIMAQNLENDISDIEQERIRRILEESVDGRLDYVLYREVESDTESLSD